MSLARKMQRKQQNKTISIRDKPREKTYTFTQKQLDDLIYDVQKEAKIETVRQVVHHMIRIGCLIVTEDMGKITRLDTRLNNFAALFSKYVREFTTLVPTGKLAEIEERLCKEVNGWEQSSK